ncbi:uncharacterized protein LOC123537026 [Mercenaria mercenaria]|uniref:uncharacterized protein LOC123537026 n=1 Tax=Mercenaria mercenaria TaxID=6596 RepID=UPI00234FB250|nr:uncharacterized protein LOC123537026 [Mercenaria mercenaria]
MVEKDAKRRRTEETGVDPIFQSFWGDDFTIQRDELRRALKILENGSDGTTFGLLQIHYTNANRSHDFTAASIEYSTIRAAKDPVSGTPFGIFFSDLFKKGMDILNNYLDDNCSQVYIPKELPERKALQKLLEFLSSEKDHEVLLEEKDYDESQWSVVLAQHLLSKLTPDRRYIIDSFRPLALETNKCLCDEMDNLVGQVGDTSFGCEKGWHGKTDIILDEQVPVSLLRKEEISETEDDSSINCRLPTDSPIPKDLPQIIARTMVFSFLQKKLNKSKWKHFLIPGIGFSGSELIIVFYDSENDVLISTKPVQLFDQKRIIYSSLLLLWFSLNFKLFCLGIPNTLKNFKACFFDFPGISEMYTNEVTRPVQFSNIDQEEGLSWSSNWAVSFNKEEEIHVDYITLNK